MSASVFPARAGMSRGAGVVSDGGLGVPRASGDEPDIEQKIRSEIECSPRERG